ncbi:hypothetical protein BESB_009510 [Besnoitia besnoiti]|uniref:Transmembrane protein n=1 Tax=Besnoitia besnoiti TaxID=94643 RepID=A0A2A9MKX3_BESBE|nr:hypothetical protein BESB_009510 [Besnoitia besnoiti]PFH38609.1 hypothetical protein BESB_009510 [Besnoitia besnoiti]
MRGASRSRHVGAGIAWLLFAAALLDGLKPSAAREPIGHRHLNLGVNPQDEGELDYVPLDPDMVDSSTSDVDDSGSVAKRFCRMINADLKQDGLNRAHVVWEAADARGMRIGMSRQESFREGLIPLITVPLFAAAGLKNRILGGTPGSHGDANLASPSAGRSPVPWDGDIFALPGSRTVGLFDAVDTGEVVKKKALSSWMSKAFSAPALAAAGAVLVGLGSWWWAAKREKSRIGLLGSGRTLMWDLTDCALLVDVERAQSLKFLYGTFVPGSARLVVDPQHQRGRLFYNERPPLVGNLLNRLRHKVIPRFEDFQLNTHRCYVRPDFERQAAATETHFASTASSAQGHLPPSHVTVGDVSFRELLDSTGKATTGLAFHLVRNPGWTPALEDSSLVVEADSLAANVNISLLAEQAAAAARGDAHAQLLLWSEEVLDSKCRVVAVFRGEVRVEVAANFATQELSIDPKTARSVRRRVHSKCLLLERQPPTLGVAFRQLTLSGGATSTSQGRDASAEEEDVVQEAHESLRESTGSGRRSRPRSLVAREESGEDTSEGGEPSDRADGEGADGALAAEAQSDAFTVFVVDFTRKPADWPALVEVRKKTPATVGAV